MILYQIIKINIYSNSTRKYRPKTMPAMEAVRKNCCWKYLAPNAMQPLMRIASKVPYSKINM